LEASNPISKSRSSNSRIRSQFRSLELPIRSFKSDFEAFIQRFEASKPISSLELPIGSFEPDFEVSIRQFVGFEANFEPSNCPIRSFKSNFVASIPQFEVAIINPEASKTEVIASSKIASRLAGRYEKQSKTLVGSHTPSLGAILTCGTSSEYGQ
jgi:hypothetical protein